MSSLSVRNFSCIDDAVLDLKRLTIITGPQASGKSVLLKLFYFFLDLVDRHISGVRVEADFDALNQHIEQEFRRWFPPTAWGDKKFSLDFQNGNITISIVRKKAHRRPSPDFHIVISENLREHYALVESQIKTAMEEAKSQKAPSSSIQAIWRVQEIARSSIAGLVGEDYVDYHMFIPAGRAFFTSIGRAIAVFEQSGILDPATIDFGRYWAAIRDNRFSDIDDDLKGSSSDLMVEIFGGRLIRERDKEYVESADGRKVPTTALSSGQQELLPLWLSIQQFFDVHPRRGERVPQALLYIEEPEAHLFPDAQSRLMQYLVTQMYSSQQARRMMLLTTHSPYVLAKLNNLVKASVVARQSKEAQSRIGQIIPRAAWIRPAHVNAYAIVDRKLVNIQEADGLIDASYIDEVSSRIMSEFSQILDVELLNGD